MAAAAAVSSPFSSQEYNSLIIRNRIDFDPYSPPPSGQSNSINENTLPTLPLGPSAFARLGLDLQDINEFDRQHGPYQPKLVRLQSNKASRENIDRLKQQCDKQKPQIRPVYIDEEVLPQNWKATVCIVEESFETTTLHPSKAHARYAAAKIAVERCKVFANQQVAGVKRKSDGSSPIAVDKTEDWISLLNNNALQTKRFTPDYQPYRAESPPPYSYSYKIQLDGGPMQPFEVGLFPSKKEAKIACAKLAVEWMRGNNYLQTPTKRPKHSGADSGHTSITQVFAAVDFDVSIQQESPPPRQRLHQLVLSLRLQHPSIKPQPVSANSAFYDVAAVFFPADVRREPSLAGPLGQELNVFGKDNAKEVCAQKVIPILEKIQQSKMTW